MVAATEILGIPLSFIIFAIFYMLAKMAEDPKQEEETKNASTWYSEVRFSKSFTLVAHPSVVFSLIECYLTQVLNFEVLHSRTPHQVLSRGDSDITRIPREKTTPWGEFPITLSLDYRSFGDTTVVEARWKAIPELELNDAVKEFFFEQAALETERIREVVEEFIRGFGEREQVKQTEYYCSDRAYDEFADDEEFGEDENDDGEIPDPGLPGAERDYEELGIRRGACWDEIQAAYRKLCRQFHPDSLSSQSLPPHLIELAESKFKSVTTAYQNLRSVYRKSA